MAIVNGSLQLGYKNSTWFAANPTLVLKEGQAVFLEQTGTYKLGDGTSQLSALTFLGNQTLSQVLANGNNVNATDINSTTGKSILSLFDGLARLFFSDNNVGYVSINDNSADISHDVLIELNASSVKKNGAELVTVNDLPNFEGLKSGGTITVGTFGGSGVDNDIRVSAASWVVGTTYYSTAINTDFLDIALSSSGLQRYIGLYGTTSNTITKVEGSEAALATYPTTPANSIVIGYVLVNDASASTTPDLSGYLLKLDKATQSTNTTGTNDTTYVTPLANAIKLNKNTAITGATKTKITYDANGLVTSGADATTADIADSTNKRYVTDANLTVIGNTSGTNSGDNATNSQYSGLAASKQDTLVSGTNIKTVNSNSLVGSGNITTPYNYRNDLIFSGSYFPVKDYLQSAYSASNGFATTLIYLQKINVPETITINSLSMIVTTNVAASNIRMAIYQGTDVTTATLVAGTDTGDLSAATTGLKEGTITATTLTKGTTYYIAFKNSSTSIAVKYMTNVISDIYRPADNLYYPCYGGANSSYATAFPASTSTLTSPTYYTYCFYQLLKIQ